VQRAGGRRKRKKGKRVIAVEKVEKEEDVKRKKKKRKRIQRRRRCVMTPPAVLPVHAVAHCVAFCQFARSIVVLRTCLAYIHQLAYILLAILTINSSIVGGEQNAKCKDIHRL
jgi:hypothetical protein